MPTESLAPDGEIQFGNLSGILSYIQDDPDDPDENWLTATDHGSDIICHASFPMPTGNPTQGAALQEFRTWIRRSRDKGNVPQCRIDLYENGVLIASGGLIDVTSLTGELKSFTWDAANLSNADGSLVEIYVLGDASGGNPANRESVDVGAVEWNVDYTTGGVVNLAGISNGAAIVTGIAKASRKMAGASAGLGTVSGTLKASRKIGGIISGAATVAGSLLVSVQLSGIANGIAGVAGAIRVSRALAGASNGLAGISGEIKAVRTLAGLVSGAATVAGELTVTGAAVLLAGIVNGVSTVAGEIKITKTLTGLISGAATVLGQITLAGAAVSRARRLLLGH